MKPFHCKSCGGSHAEDAGVDKGLLTCSHCGSIYELGKQATEKHQQTLLGSEKLRFLVLTAFVAVMAAGSVLWLGKPNNHERLHELRVEQRQANNISEREQEPDKVERSEEYQGRRLHRTRNLGLQFVQMDSKY